MREIIVHNTLKVKPIPAYVDSALFVPLKKPEISPPVLNEAVNYGLSDPVKAKSKFP